MAVFTLFDQQVPAGSSATDASAYTMGVQFSVSATARLTGVWFFTQAASSFPAQIALFLVSDLSLVHFEAATWTGSAGGWVRAGFATPPALALSTAYVAAVLTTPGAGGNGYTNTAHYWDTGPGAGGLTNGPLTAPNNAGATFGQDAFHAGSSLAFPGNTFNATNYWVDPEITTPGAHSATAALTVTPTQLIVSHAAHPRAAAVAVSPVITAAAVIARPIPVAGVHFSTGGARTAWQTGGARTCWSTGGARAQ